MRRAIVVLVLLVAPVLSACGSVGVKEPAGCVTPAGGRCAAEVAWPGPIVLSPDGRRLHGVVMCGGDLHATETRGQVTLALHVGAMGPGTMSCARVDVGVRLDAPLGSRTVVDRVSGRVLHVVADPGTADRP